MDKRSFIFVLFLTISLFLVHQWFTREQKPTSNPIRTEQVGVAAPPELPHPLLPPSLTNEEQFYVLENEYQQLVFSSLGGSLAEINLVFHSEKNPQSVVREIGFDRTLKKEYANNDYFPSSSYFIANPDGSSNPIKIPQGHLGGYYPLLRRTIFTNDRHAYIRIPVHYYSLNVAEQQGENFPVVNYKLKRLEKNLIELESVESHRKITKTFSFPKNHAAAPYCFDLSIKVEGDARGLSLTSGVPEVELISGNSSPSLKYRITRNGKSQVEQIDLPKTATVFTSIHPDWMCNSNGFLGLIIDPLTEIGSGFTAYRVPGDVDPTRLSLIDAQYRLYPAQDYPGYQIHLPLRASNEPIQLRVFAGPFESDVLKKVDMTYADSARGYNPDYIASQSFHGWFAFISEPFAKFLFFLMKLFYQLTHSWGVSIILLTLALRIMLYPLNGWSIKSTMRMQQVAPQVAQIQEKYKKDPKRAQLEIMTLYREKGVNPLTGCFPILIQIPFLIGMFDLLKSTFELRGASFIPGWIDNLTAPDVLFTWNYPIFFFGNSFHLLPFLLGLVMYLQQRFSSPLPKDKKLLTDQQRQQKMMGNIMVIVFTVMFYKFPSGLNIYWLSSMLLGILQQWWMTRKLPKKGTLVVLNK